MSFFPLAVVKILVAYVFQAARCRLFLPGVSARAEKGWWSAGSVVRATVLVAVWRAAIRGMVVASWRERIFRDL
ncbi:hypothetical protein [Streptomyces phaeochromogenes]|uniref:hypothetical protein n=1 Tax=Streptomyces phaeochromogenes TaxID=1923 RepID=UPI002DDBA3AE|nr:hypothetical protein [Streptomyces phaeochromogenes]WRZ31003.1 hypothetical protein OG931_26300 [Streptomyces phaeochromogenes]